MTEEVKEEQVEEKEGATKEGAAKEEVTKEAAAKGETKEKEKTGMPELEKPIEKMTVKDLRELAKDIPGVTGVTAMKKEELLTLLREEWGIDG